MTDLYFLLNISDYAAVFFNLVLLIISCIFKDSEGISWAKCEGQTLINGSKVKLFGNSIDL